MSDHEEVEPLEPGCEFCGVGLGTGLHLVPEAKGLPGICLECAQDMDRTDDSAAEEGPGIEDSDSYREALRDAGRSHLLGS
jgi:hypothetical protein